MVNLNGQLLSALPESFAQLQRSPGGLHLPTENTPQFLVTAAPLQSGVFEWPEYGLNIYLSKTVRLPVDSLSGIKMLNGARYVAAAREARASVDDAIVLSSQGRVCEATAAMLSGWRATPCLSHLRLMVR